MPAPRACRRLSIGADLREIDERTDISRNSDRMSVVEVGNQIVFILICGHVYIVWGRGRQG
ncbi:hypothetical protein M501DRAFT_61756 [Patellaria atrata CBS 101060]|uniref:Uncharacterized protein n=1 Tax=Patellaria atrata CBS 101060 TaxID=1346257 RepID=A0A9P4SK92_9PEZI|nr:hypothetical protein M501DRAFT_61756 [Patellaria atrata CBS 101060]